MTLEEPRSEDSEFVMVFELHIVLTVTRVYHFFISLPPPLPTHTQFFFSISRPPTVFNSWTPFFWYYPPPPPSLSFFRVKGTGCHRRRQRADGYPRGLTYDLQPE